MKIPKLPLFAVILALVATLFFVPARLHADTYKIIDLGNDEGRNIIDIDSFGDVIIFDTHTSEYLTVDNGVVVNTTSTLPNLIYDNGTPCAEPAGFSDSAGRSLCNNGHVAFGSRYNQNGDEDGVYTGFLSSLTMVDPSGSDDLAVLNSSGDFAWADGVREESFEAIDLVPEPGSLVLVGTGCISLFCLLRRKLA
jgi:PEP-CTERM motif